MRDDLTCHVDWPCPSPVSVRHLPLAKMSSSKHTHRVGGIWHEQGIQYCQDPFMCVQCRCWQQDCSAPLGRHWGSY